MERFLKENGFVKLQKKSDDVKSIFHHPETGVMVTIFHDGSWKVGKTGEDSMKHVEYWRNWLMTRMRDKGMK